MQIECAFLQLSISIERWPSLFEEVAIYQTGRKSILDCAHPKHSGGAQQIQDAHWFLLPSKIGKDHLRCRHQRQRDLSANRGHPTAVGAFIPR